MLPPADSGGRGGIQRAACSLPPPVGSAEGGQISPPKLKKFFQRTLDNADKVCYNNYRKLRKEVIKNDEKRNPTKI